MSTEAELYTRLLNGMREFYRVISASTAGGRMIEREGLWASVVPAVPHRSVVNCVAYQDPGALATAYDDLAAAFDHAGVRAWTVWVPEEDREAATLLEARGHVLDASPAAMARGLDGIERPGGGGGHDWIRDGDPRVMAGICDRAFGFGDDSFTRIWSDLPRGEVGVYVASHEDTPIACLATHHHDGNCEIDGVAVLPEGRGSGVAGRLLANALVDARERGCTTTSLIATSMGRRTYEKLGYATLRTLEMWERRR